MFHVAFLPSNLQYVEPNTLASGRSFPCFQDFPEALALLPSLCHKELLLLPTKADFSLEA